MTPTTFDPAPLINALRVFIRTMPMSRPDQDRVLIALETSAASANLTRNAKQRIYDRQRRAAGLVRPLTKAQRKRATAYMRRWRAEKRAQREALQAAAL